MSSYHSKFFKSASKPKEKSRSASSTTSISRDECRSRFWALRCASTRDGVPTTTSGFSIKIGLVKYDSKHQPTPYLIHIFNYNSTIENIFWQINSLYTLVINCTSTNALRWIHKIGCQAHLCADRSAFPEMSATRTSLEQYAVNCLIMAWTCWPSSLVGTRIKALTSCSRTLWRHHM